MPEVLHVHVTQVPTCAARSADSMVRAAAGTVAVIAPARMHPELRAALDLEGSTRSTAIDPLDDPVALLTPQRSKGLEFDAVIIVEPEEIADPGDTPGLLALYVALTRTTGELTIIHSGPLPAVLRASA
jgi:DNA helicase IV